MALNINIPIPGRFELILAKLFGVRRVSNCMDSYVETYYWRGKFYVTKQWQEPKSGPEKDGAE